MKSTNSNHQASLSGGDLITESPTFNNQVNPEFLDCTGIQARFGIKRGLAYQLLADGRIKGVSLRKRGALKGKRLFSVDSVRAYLMAEMNSASN